MQPYLNKDVEKTLVQALKQPAGSYLLDGPEHSGKFYILRYLAEQIHPHPQNLLIVEAAKASIGIADVHQLNSELKLKTFLPTPRIVIIRDADTMTVEAQNAFLKTLEEPPEQTGIFLTSHRPSVLLATILSRVKKISYPQISETEISDYLTSQLGITSAIAREASALSSGRLGLAIKLAKTADLLAEYKTRAQLAETLNDGHSDTYERLKAFQQPIDQLDLPELLSQTVTRLRQAQRQAIEAGNVGAIKLCNRKIKYCLALLRYLEANGNAKLALNQLVLGI